MTTSTHHHRATPARMLARLALMAAIVVALVIASAPLRQIYPLELRIASNLLFFVALGSADEWLLAPILDGWPLARMSVLITTTLALGWYFSPQVGTKYLMYTHVAPFFVAVIGGALVTRLILRRRS
jgi:hypothetical protein